MGAVQIVTCGVLITESEIAQLGVIHPKSHRGRVGRQQAGRHQERIALAAAGPDAGAIEHGHTREPGDSGIELRHQRVGSTAAALPLTEVALVPWAWATSWTWVPPPMSASDSRILTSPGAGAGQPATEPDRRRATAGAGALRAGAVLDRCTAAVTHAPYRVASEILGRQLRAEHRRCIRDRTRFSAVDLITAVRAISGTGAPAGRAEPAARGIHPAAAGRGPTAVAEAAGLRPTRADRRSRGPRGSPPRRLPWFRMVPHSPHSPHSPQPSSAGLLVPGTTVGWIRSYSGSVAGAAAATGAAVGTLAGAEVDAMAVGGTVLAEICGGVAT